MKSRICLATVALFIPIVADACGGDGPDYIAIAFLIAICIAVVAAFLIPLAGMLALKPGKPVVIVRMVLVYGAVTVTAMLSAVLMQPSVSVTVFLLLLCAVLVVAPSGHYLAHALRTNRANILDQSA